LSAVALDLRRALFLTKADKAKGDVQVCVAAKAIEEGVQQALSSRVSPDILQA